MIELFLELLLLEGTLEPRRETGRTSIALEPDPLVPRSATGSPVLMLTTAEYRLPVPLSVNVPNVWQSLSVKLAITIWGG